MSFTASSNFKMYYMHYIKGFSMLFDAL